VVEINNPFVSVVIPVLNMDQTVGLTLDSLLSQVYENREVIVVDGGSADKTKDVVSKYPVKLLESGKKSIPYQRNLGIEHSTGEIVAFTDADCVADKNWLKYLIQNYSEDSVVACGGSILPYAIPYVDYKPQTLIERFSVKEFVGPNLHLDTEKPIKLKKRGLISSCIFGGNSSYRKSFLDEIGGFDNNIKIGEDIDSCHRIHKMGLTIIYDPRAVVYHRVKRTINSSMAQYYKYGKARAPIYKKYSSKKFFIDNEYNYYQNLYFNAFNFLKRLATVHSQEDKELYLFTPIMNSLLISSMITGKIKGSTEHGILTL
jgi:glycosyltransferase involved in cell wall biosynthesis